MKHQEKIKLLMDSLIFVTSGKEYEKFLEQLDNSRKVQIHSIRSEWRGAVNGNTFILHHFDFESSNDNKFLGEDIRIVVAFKEINSSFEVIEVSARKDEG